MSALQLLKDLFMQLPRQGPGGDAETRIALGMCSLDTDARLRVADLSCGTGATALLLAETLDAEITVVNSFPEFLDELMRNAKSKNLAHKFRPVQAQLDALPFEENSLDLIWAEDSVFTIGFEAGIGAWKPFLRPGGYLVVSDITWLSVKRPAALTAFWKEAYPEAGLPSAKMRVLEKYGFCPVGYFPLPEHCWTDNYHRPLQQAFEAFLNRNGNSGAAQAIVGNVQAEISFYSQYKSWYSYGMYVARKLV